MNKKSILTLTALLIVITCGCTSNPVSVESLPTTAAVTAPTAAATTTATVRAKTAATAEMDSSNNLVDLTQAFANAWGSQEPDKVMPFYSKDIEAYDASMYGQVFDYSEVKSVLTGDSYRRGRFIWEMDSFFVSDDGRFAALIGTFKDGNTIKPCMSLVEFNDGQIIWKYDYYGGALSDEYSSPEIPANASQPASSTEVVAETKAMLADWEAAYDRENAQDIISYYADSITFTYITGPKWYVFTKEQLFHDLNSSFDNEQFIFQLNDYFVSKDGHFAAVQGVYADDYADEQPIVTLLEIENGKIIEQYVYIDSFLLKGSNQFSQEMKPSATPAEISHSNEMPDEWDLVLFSDSSGRHVAAKYAALIENELGVKVHVRDFSSDALSLGKVLATLERHAQIGDSLGSNNWNTIIAESEVVVIYANPEESMSENNPGDWHCISPPYQVTDCGLDTFEKYIEDYETFYAKVFELRAGQPTIIRAFNAYMPLYSGWKRENIFEACRQCWLNYNEAISIAAEKYNVPVAPVYETFNGVYYDEDPRDKGYIGYDGMHTSDEGSQAIADALHSLGYEITQPPEESGVTENMDTSTLTYIAFGDSTVVIPGIGLKGFYAEMLSEDLGVEVILVDRTFLSGGAPRLIQLLAKPVVQEELRTADVITLQIPTHKLEGPMRLYSDDPEACGGEDHQDCLREAFNQYKQDTDAIFASLMEFADPARQIIRVQDTYLFNVTAIKESGDFEVYNQYWSDAQRHIREVAETYGLPVARVYDEFMGPDGTDDPATKGLVSDITHASEEGAKLMAQLIRELGYTYAPAEE